MTETTLKAKETKERKRLYSETIEHDDTSDDDESAGAVCKYDKKKAKKRKTEHIPVSIRALFYLDPSVAIQCKEVLRPVRIALRLASLSEYTLLVLEKDGLLKTRLRTVLYKKCLVVIGEQIEQHLMQYKDEEQIIKWRDCLWYFVSKLTNIVPQKLRIMNRHALKGSLYKHALTEFKQVNVEWKKAIKKNIRLNRSNVENYFGLY